MDNEIPKIKLAGLKPSDVDKLLRKYEGDDSFSKIEISMSFEEEDAQIIRIMKKSKQDLIEIISKKSKEHRHVIEILNHIDDIDENLLLEKKLFNFKIDENASNMLRLENFENELDKQILFYTKNIELFSIFVTEMKVSIKPNYLHIGAQRGTNETNLMICLSQTGDHTQRRANNQGLYNRQNSHVIQCFVYFAKKHLEAQSIEKFEKDIEVKQFRDALRDFGYEIELDCVNRIKNTYIFQIKYKGIEIKIEEMSSGEYEILNLLFALFSENLANGTVVIDEPELHIHPTWQRKQFEMLRKLARKRRLQIIFATHSASYISAENLSNIFRVRNESGSGSLITELKNEPSNKDKYHLINATNNEALFFASNVVLVEGISDKIIFTRIFQNLLPESKQDLVDILSINGKSNVEKFTSILEELKVPWVFIGDLDVLEQTGSQKVKDFFVTDEKAIDAEVVKNKSSKDLKTIFGALKEVVEKYNKEKLQDLTEILEYIEGRFRRLRNLEGDELVDLRVELEQQKLQNYYLLEKGEIEDYYSSFLNKRIKSVDSVISLCTDKFSEWKKTDDYKELETLCKEIITSKFLIPLD